MLIFAIDDEKIILEDERRILEKAAEGAEILTFTRGKAALDAVPGKSPLPFGKRKTAGRWSTTGSACLSTI